MALYNITVMRTSFDNSIDAPAVAFQMHSCKNKYDARLHTHAWRKIFKQGLAPGVSLGDKHYLLIRKVSG